MFNGDLKKEAIENLNSSIKVYEYLTGETQAKSAELFVLRKKSSQELIGKVERYVNKLANSPKEFDKSFSEYKAEYKFFTDLLDELNNKSETVDYKFGTTATAGVL